MLGFFLFLFLINCVGVLGLHGGDGGDERERERETHTHTHTHKNIFYCVNILF